MDRYTELLGLIENAESRQREAMTEWEWEHASAELEELYAERDRLDMEVDDWTYEDEVSSLDAIRKAGF